MMYILKYLGDVCRYCSLLWNALEIRWIDRWIEAWIDGEECDRVTVAIVNGGVRAVGIWVLAVQFFQLCCWLKIFTIKCWEKKIFRVVVGIGQIWKTSPAVLGDIS